MAELFRMFDTSKFYIQPQNTSFSWFVLPKVCEMIRNTPKHRFGSNRLDWMRLWQNFFRKFDTSKFYIQPQNISFSWFVLSKVYQMIWNTPKHRFGSNRLDRMCSWQNFFRKFDTSKFYIQPQNTSFSWFVMPKVCEMIWNTPKHRFGSNRLDWMRSW